MPRPQTLTVKNIFAVPIHEHV